MLTFKRKLLLNKSQEARLDSWIGVCRLIYNMGLQIQQESYKNNQTFIPKYQLMKQLKDIREIDWIRDVPAEAQGSVIVRLDGAYQKFFKGMGYPKWATKRKYRSITFRQSLRVEENKINVPKLGLLKIVKDSDVHGVPKTITIKKESAGYFACITTDAVKSIRNQDENQVLGIDIGLKHFIVDSNGRFISNPKHFQKHERQLRIENRSLARKKKGGKNWLKQAKKLSRFHHRIGNIRKDFLHKLSTKIAKENNVVFIEDLNISGMKRSNMSKSISDAGWAKFRTMLQYKTEVISVNACYSSQQCSNCGYVDSKNRKTQSEFECKSCGSKLNADKNAALNILSRGTAHVRERKAIA